MNIFFRVFFEPKYFWVFGFGAWFIWVFGFGFGFESIPVIKTQRPKKTKHQTQTQKKPKRNRLILTQI